MLLWTYVDPNHGAPWIAASLQVAHASKRGTYWAKNLRKWTREFISTRSYPKNLYGAWTNTLITNEDFKQELNNYLQSVGKYVTAEHLMRYTQQWMNKLDYRWTKEPSGQYVDGHEHKDVTDYRQDVFLPEMAKYESKTRAYDNNGNELAPQNWPHDMEDGPRPYEDVHVFWYHDESTFYTNDQRKVGWVHAKDKAVPRAKGEGPSLMVADFVSADYGWLRSPDRTESARVLFKAGIERQGYFTNEDVQAQAHRAMDILDKHHLHEKHVLIFDNATTHRKRADDALSARRMPKGPSRCMETNFGVQKNRLGEDEQEFYFPDGHLQAGIFKGMAIILEERGYNVSGKNAECESFRCKPGATDCCCRRMLFNQPDFVSIKSLLEQECEARGYKFPPSSREADLERNVVEALDSVPFLFCARALRHTDAYRKGLNGAQAAYASKKYRGHRVLPVGILKECEDAGVTRSDIKRRRRGGSCRRWSLSLMMDLIVEPPFEKPSHDIGHIVTPREALVEFA
ncbi:hypothetical protein BJ165DRAFT_1604839 [Panaeolus papilionaceus]|nr:hypothetical protein BJ165DRAFT_1604839 [Panaeolus papilionaceus]